MHKRGKCYFENFAAKTVYGQKMSNSNTVNPLEQSDYSDTIKKIKNLEEILKCHSCKKLPSVKEQIPEVYYVVDTCRHQLCCNCYVSYGKGKLKKCPVSSCKNRRDLKIFTDSDKIDVLKNLKMLKSLLLKDGEALDGDDPNVEPLHNQISVSDEDLSLIHI